MEEPEVVEAKNIALGEYALVLRPVYGQRRVLIVCWRLMPKMMILWGRLSLSVPGRWKDAVLNMLLKMILVYTIRKAGLKGKMHCGSYLSQVRHICDLRCNGL